MTWRQIYDSDTMQAMILTSKQHNGIVKTIAVFDVVNNLTIFQSTAENVGRCYAHQGEYRSVPSPSLRVFGQSGFSIYSVPPRYLTKYKFLNLHTEIYSTELSNIDHKYSLK